MPIAIVRLGVPRMPGEGLRLGTVRHPPRGVKKSEIARRDYFDVWLPLLAPSRDLMAFAKRSADEGSWKLFERSFRAEMHRSDVAKVLDLLAALSHETRFSLGCYCEREERCHRSILRMLLHERGAVFA